ncbi:MAG TPA: histidinol phosphate phosphatase [Lentisphaeria bacterium]|nr:MAG: hypothetical protein A2X47_12845 [Lentisphaerae bacterium GWF2_38_69]HBM14731.1 histidinol phosphate phosphatase [Lentisphaeria bacterium]
MTVICDYHTHTPLCKHAVGAPIEYVRQAHEKGIKIIGFSDHCPAPSNFDTECRMDISLIEKYIEMIENVKNNSYGVKVLLGMEVDYVPGRMDEVLSLTNKYNFDYLIGSIHYVDDYPFDHPGYIDKWNTSEKINYVWEKYADLLIEMVTNFKIDIIGHLDLPKKFKMYPTNMDYVFSKLTRLFQIAVQKDISIEINTAGKRKIVEEFYPSLEILKLIKESGCSITFGSDAHAPDEVCSDFLEASIYAANAGFSEYTIILGKNIKQKEKLI